VFGWRNPFLVKLTGSWRCYESIAWYRIPVMVLFVAICGYLAIWPAQKNLGTTGKGEKTHFSLFPVQHRRGVLPEL
jgi:hypothetical protein